MKTIKDPKEIEHLIGKKVRVKNGIGREFYAIYVGIYDDGIYDDGNEQAYEFETDDAIFAFPLGTQFEIKEYK